MEIGTTAQVNHRRYVDLEQVSTIGSELELRIAGRDGYIRNEQHTFLADGRVPYSTEPILDVMEINGPAGGAETIHQEHQQMDPLLTNTIAIAEENGLIVVPGSRFTSGIGELVQGRPRFEFYNNSIGEEGLSRLLGIVGVHNHISLVQGRELDQYRLFLALDPLWIALASTSPISDKGETHLNCARIDLLRNIIFADKRYGAKLESYPHSFEEIVELGPKRHVNWAELSGMSPKRLEEIGFDPTETVYEPLRLKKKIGPNGTIEQRSGDSCPLDVLLAIQALSKGIHDRIIRDSLPVTINDYFDPIASKNSAPFYFGPEGVVLPDYATLKCLEQGAIQEGIRHNLLNRYAQEALTFATEGLPTEDKPYLVAAAEMVKSRTNLADQLMDHLRTNHRYQNGNIVTPEQSAAASLYLADRFKTGLETLKPLL